MLTEASIPVSKHDSRQLTDLLNTVNRFVPFYRRLWEAAGITAEQLKMPGDWERLPIVHKADFRRFPLEDRLDERFTRASLKKLSTSGSSGQPFEVLLNRASVWRRQKRTFHGLWYCGFRPGHRFVWMKDLPFGSRARPSILRRLARMTYINMNLDPENVIEEYRAQRPDLVYGQLSALVMLAEGVDQQNKHSPRIVVGFGEQFTASVRRLVATRLGAEVSEFYGTTEVGLMAVRRPGETCYKISQPDLLLEYVPVQDAPGFERLIVTNLGGGAMPFVRYDTGDLVRRDHSRPDRPIIAMGGRELDFLTMRDGQRIGPFRIDTALYQLPGLQQYRIVQQADHSVDLYVTAGQRPAAEVMRDAGAALAGICGPGLVLRVTEQAESPTSATAKLRVIQTHIRPAPTPR